MTNTIINLTRYALVLLLIGLGISKTMANPMDNVKVIPVNQASSNTYAVALGTIYGEVLPTSAMTPVVVTRVGQLLNQNQIEFQGGTIIYPEEIEYILSPGRGLEKAPHTPN